jgi:hypothetical protein
VSRRATTLKIVIRSAELEAMDFFSTDSPARTSRNRTAKVLSAVLACAAVAATGPGVASAASSSPAPCAGPISNPFLAWGDSEGYRLAPDGDFSSAPTQWELSDGAEIIASDSPLSGGGALELDKKESALSPPICLDGSESFSRVLTTSDGPGQVLVRAVGPNGHAVPVGAFRGDEEWAPSDAFLAPSRLASRGYDSFRYSFTAVGKGTTVIDDLYVDPRVRH